MSGHVDNWINRYCPECYSNDGFDSLVLSLCKKCEWSGLSEDVLTNEQMINKKRFDKLKDILE